MLGSQARIHWIAAELRLGRPRVILGRALTEKVTSMGHVQVCISSFLTTRMLIVDVTLEYVPALQ